MSEDEVDTRACHSQPRAAFNTTFMEELNFKTNSQALNPRHVRLDYYHGSNTARESVCHAFQLQHFVWKMASAQLGLFWTLHFGQ